MWIGQDSLEVPVNAAGGGLTELTAVGWAELVEPGWA